eukprot:2600519-Rhodomonas_salina.1
MIGGTMIGGTTSGQTSGGRTSGGTTSGRRRRGPTSGGTPRATSTRVRRWCHVRPARWRPSHGRRGRWRPCRWRRRTAATKAIGRTIWWTGEVRAGTGGARGCSERA